MGRRQGIDGEALGITLGAADRSKPGVDEVSGLVLADGSGEVTWVGNLEVAGLVEGGPLGNLGGTRVGDKLGIYGGEVPGITLVVADRRKLGGDEVSGQLSTGGSCEDTIDSNP